MKKLIGVMLIFFFGLVVYTDNSSQMVLYDFDEAEEQQASSTIQPSVQRTEDVPDRLPGPKIGEAAPEFKLKNLSGETIALSEFKGKKVLINFWAAWCSPCTKELPALQAFMEANVDGIEVISINIDPEEHAAEFAENAGVTFPVLLDEKDEVNEAYQIISIPTTFLIDEEGKVINKHIGALDEEGFHVFVQ
ncbi:peroxiredoxin family protein [Bacillus sp. AK031]